MDLVALEHVKRAKYRYLRCVDLKLWDELADALTADATAEYGTPALGTSLSFTGRTEILDFLHTHLGGTIITTHSAGQPEIDIDGDASYLMTCYELATIAEYNIPVKAVILNNDFQGMVKQWQDLFYEERYSGTKMNNPDFVKFAEAMNCEAFRCSEEDTLAEDMARFLAAEGPILGEFMVEKNEHCYPMVGAGRSLDEMIIGDFDDCPGTTSI